MTWLERLDRFWGSTSSMPRVSAERGTRGSAERGACGSAERGNRGSAERGNRASAARRSRRSLTFEALESRQLLAAEFSATWPAALPASLSEAWPNAAIKSVAELPFATPRRAGPDLGLPDFFAQAFDRFSPEYRDRLSLRVEELATRLTSSGTDQDRFFIGFDPATSADWVVPQTDLSVPQTLQSGPLIGLTEFRQTPAYQEIDGRGFSTVIIDTGINLSHPAFGPAITNGIADRILYTEDLSSSNNLTGADTDGHGSHVSSIVASSSATAPGMAPGAGIIHLKVFPDNPDQGASSADIEQALQWVVANTQRYNIASVNLSLGSGNDTRYSAESWYDEFAALSQLGVIVAAASGNSFYDLNSALGVSSPASDPNVIAVGAVFDANIGGITYGGGARASSTAPDQITPFTQRHPDLLDVLAPGAAIVGAASTGTGFVTMDGTSMASPHVSGLAVLAQQLAVTQLGRRLTVGEFLTLVRATGVSVVDNRFDADNVTNTGATFPRIDILALGNAILGLRPAGMTGQVHYQTADGTGGLEPASAAGWDLFLDDNNNATLDSMTTTISSSDVPSAMQDFTALRSDLLVAELPGRITEISLTLDIDHSYTADLEAYLISPAGVRVALFSGVGNQGNDFQNTRFSDSAAVAIDNGLAPFAGTFRPAQPLNALRGSDPNGRWQLEIADLGLLDTGSLQSWSLTIQHQELRTTTDADGLFAFSGLAAATYQLRAVPPAEVLAKGVPLLGESYQAVLLTPATTASGLRFDFQDDTAVRVDAEPIRLLATAGGVPTAINLSSAVTLSGNLETPSYTFASEQLPSGVTGTLEGSVVTLLIAADTSSFEFAYSVSADGVSDSSTVSVDIEPPKPIDPIRFDLGTTTSLVANGFVRMAGSATYSPTMGFGWATAATAFSRTLGQSQLRDGHSGQANTFHVDVPNGEYWVNVTFGDASSSLTGISLSVADQLTPVIAGLNLPRRQFRGVGFSAVVTDGQLDLRFTAPSRFAVNSIELWSASARTEHSLAVSAWLNGVATLSGSGAGSGELVTVQLDRGRLRTTDVDTLYQEHQVRADSAGNFRLQILSPLSGGELRVRTADINGLANGELVLPEAFPARDQWALDFGTSNTYRVAAGYLGVGTTNQFDSFLGYGWEATAPAFSRSVSAPLTRDGHSGRSNTFRVELPDGRYAVTVVIGDPFFAVNSVSIAAESLVIRTGISLPRQVFEEVRFEVDVNDGTLDLLLTAPSRFAVNAVTIRPV